MVNFPNTFGIANTTGTTAKKKSTSENKPEDLSGVDRYNPQEVSYYRHPSIAITSKSKSTWKLTASGKTISRNKLEDMAERGPVEVTFERRVPDTSKPANSKLKRVLETTLRVGLPVVAAAAITPTLLVCYPEIKSGVADAYADSKYPWKTESIQGQFSVEDSMVSFQPKGQEPVDLGMTAYMIACCSPQ